MTEDIVYVGDKLHRWQEYLNHFQLPAWREIPDIGLFMDQVVTLLTQYLDYLPPELKEDSSITPAAINNYVRMRIMPSPIKKRYYRVHIAYLLMICTLKQTLSISLLQKIIPAESSETEVETVYGAYARRHSAAVRFFLDQVRQASEPIMKGTAASEKSVSDLIFFASIISGFSKLFAEKLILLEPAESEAPEEEKQS